jgi:hypothetical protein
MNTDGTPMEPALNLPWYLQINKRVGYQQGIEQGAGGLFFNPSPLFLTIARDRDGFDANQQGDYRAQREYSCQGEKNNEKRPLKQANGPVSTDN